MAVLFNGTRVIEAAAVHTATYQTVAQTVVGLDTLRSPQFVNIQIRTSATSGTTPSYTFAVEWSNDGTNWAAGSPADAFTAITANGNVVKQFAAKASLFRLNCTVTGTTPSTTVDSSYYVA